METMNLVSITYCALCGGALSCTYMPPVTTTTGASSSVTLTSGNAIRMCICASPFCAPIPLSHRPITMRRFILEFEELCEEDDIWYPARQEGCVSSGGDAFVFDYKLPLPAAAWEQESRYEHFSTYRRMIAVYDRRPFIRNVTITWIDSDGTYSH